MREYSHCHLFKYFLRRRKNDRHRLNFLLYIYSYIYKDGLRRFETLLDRSDKGEERGGWQCVTILHSECVWGSPTHTSNHTISSLHTHTTTEPLCARVKIFIRLVRVMTGHLDAPVNNVRRHFESCK